MNDPDVVGDVLFEACKRKDDEINRLRALLREAYHYVDTSKDHTFFKAVACPACELVAKIDAALSAEKP